VFSNPRLLRNIRDAKQVLTLDFNAGKAIVTKKGDLKGYSTVWYNPESTAHPITEQCAKEVQGDLR